MGVEHTQLCRVRVRGGGAVLYRGMSILHLSLHFSTRSLTVTPVFCEGEIVAHTTHHHLCEARAPTQLASYTHQLVCRVPLTPLLHICIAWVVCVVFR